LGERLTSEQAEKLQQLQKKEIVDGISFGVNLLQGEVEIKDPVFAEIIQETKGAMSDIRSIDVNDMSSVASLREAADLAQSLLASLYSNSISEKFRIGGEYAIGLLRSELNVRLGLLVARKMEEMNLDKFKEASVAVNSLGFGKNEQVDFIGGFSSTAEVSNKLVLIMNQVFYGQSDEYWSQYDQALQEIEGLDEIARDLVSMQYVPNQDEMDTVGLMQAAHWAGFGGNGMLFDEIPGLDSEFIRSQNIGWHSEGEPFTDKLAHFKSAIIPLKAYEAKTVGKLVDDFFADKSEIRIFDSGAGPVARGSHGIAEQLEERGKKVVINASDVDGNSIKSLSNLEGKPVPNESLNNTVIGETLYWDANFPLKNAPTDVADVFVTSVMLHQVMDKKNGHDRVGKFLQSATKMTVDGGIISWSDTGEKVYIQSQMIPFNGTDREGCVPRDIFTRINYSDVAVPCSEEKDGEMWYKIPFRFADLRHATPDSIVSKYGSGLYEYNVFRVIAIPESVLSRLDLAQNEQDRLSLVSDYLDSKNVTSMCQQTGNRISQIVD